MADRLGGAAGMVKLTRGFSHIPQRKSGKFERQQMGPGKSIISRSIETSLAPEEYIPIKNCLFCGKKLPKFTKTFRVRKSNYCNKAHQLNALAQRRRMGKPKVWRGVRRAGL